MSASNVAELEQENARLGVALGDAYAVLGKTKTALKQLQAHYDALKHELDWFKRQLQKQIRADGLVGEDKRAYRQTHTRAVVETFWRWCRAQCHRTELLPKSPLAKALHSAQQRRSGLEVFLDDPEGAIDTNHLERALRPILSENETGCSLRARSVRSAWASSRVCW